MSEMVQVEVIEYWLQQKMLDRLQVQQMVGSHRYLGIQTIVFRCNTKYVSNGTFSNGISSTGFLGFYMDIDNGKIYFHKDGYTDLMGNLVVQQWFRFFIYRSIQ